MKQRDLGLAVTNSGWDRQFQITQVWLEKGQMDKQYLLNNLKLKYSHILSIKYFSSILYNDVYMFNIKC